MKIQGLVTWRYAATALAVGIGWLAWTAPIPDAEAQMGMDGQVIRGFEVPEFDRENRLRSRLYGELARMLSDGKVDITGMRIEFYDDDREVEMRVSAESCLYNRVSGSATSETGIRIARENMIITGRGFDWDAESERFEIHNEAKVVFKDLKIGAQAGEDEEQ